jgi:hypothetical protein
MNRLLVGTDVIASTGDNISNPNAARIFLDMGGYDGEDSRGKVGYSCAGFEPVYFPAAKVPRQRWTHVALVCMGRPKRRVTLYVDGTAVGLQKDIIFNLPMTSIGGVEHSFHGCILDCRYWGKPRSSLQVVKEDMHGLISFSSVVNVSSNGTKSGGKMGMVRQMKRRKETQEVSSDGLIGWWTFEDGIGSKRVADVSGHRYKSLIKKNPPTATRWLSADAVSMSALPKTNGVFEEPPPLPVPSYRERNLCPHEIRRYKLAQRGRLLMLETDCPLGCPQGVRRIDIRFHVRYV